MKSIKYPESRCNTFLEQKVLLSFLRLNGISKVPLCGVLHAVACTKRIINLARSSRGCPLDNQHRNHLRQTVVHSVLSDPGEGFHMIPQQRNVIRSARIWGDPNSTGLCGLLRAFCKMVKFHISCF